MTSAGDMGNDNLENKVSKPAETENAFSDDLQSVWGPDAQENQAERQVKGGDLASADTAVFQGLSQAFRQIDPALADSFSRIAQKMETLASFPEWQQDRGKIMGPSIFAEVNQVADPAVVKNLLKKMSNIGNV